MRIDVKSIILVFLMLALSLSVATNSLNGEVENPTFKETAEPLNVILPIADLNEPGFQEGSIFTDSTLSSGDYHSCAVLDDGSVSCWGYNGNGQLGDGTTTDRNTPTQTSSLGTGRTAVAISSGGSHTCAVLDDGSVSCWGYNGNGQLGDGTTTQRSTSTQTSSLGTGRTAVAISSGEDHTCAVLDDGSVSCWGYNGYGQLGDGTTTDRNTPTQTSSLGTGRTAVAISSGDSHTCAVLDDGSVSCWGYNGNFELGIGTNTYYYESPTQTSSLGTGRTAVAISSGDSHTCAVLDDGSVSCWGYNGDGQLGDGTTANRSTPTPTSSLGTGRTAVAISSGWLHTCAVLDDGSVTCWGLNIAGQLGDGTTTNRTTPTQTSSLGSGRTAVAISSGSSWFTCVILDDGSVSCWGYNIYNQLGDGTTTSRTTPTQTSSLGTTTNPRNAALSERDFDGDGILNIFDVHQNLDYRESAISSGYRHTCAILDNGSVSCWGENSDGRLGDGMLTDRSTPTQTSSLGTGRTAVAISSGKYHTCALLDDGSVSCWGDNGNYQLGDGTTTDRNTPTQTSSLGTGRTAVAISSGDYHTCAILDDGSVSCWGYNNQGRLGDGTTTDRSTPTPTSSLGFGRTAVAISSAYQHTCIILDDGIVSCWGANGNGQLGDGTTTQKSTPTQTSSLGTGRTAVAISTGKSYTCAVLDDGTVSCWGYNGNGRLGDGTTTNRNTPTPTSSLGFGRTAVTISSGGSLTCALLDNGSVSCWGSNSLGELGDGTTTNRVTPAQTSSLGTGRTAVAISSGNYHTCAVLDNASVSCWGYNAYSQLGDGTTTDRNTPTQTSNFGTGRTALLVDGDADGDGTLDHLDDDFPNNSIRSIACMSGQYGRYVCVDAPAGKYVSSSSAMYATNCLAGTYNPNTGSTSSFACGDADAGYYAPTPAQSSQTACSIGTYQALTGQSSCDDASQGYYVSSTAQSSQTACATGTYQALTGQASCDDADAGYYVPSTALSGQTACLAGTYQALTGQASCNDADAGYYVSSIAQSNQTACLAGTYNPNVGSTSPSACGDADAGYYVSSIAQSNQTACAIGTYQTLTGQSSCDDAPAGYYVSSTGQSSTTACATGTYQALTGQSFCDYAAAGYYVPGLGQSSQTAASQGYYVQSTGQSNQLACYYGTYQPLTGQTSCDDADAGYYAPTPAQSSQTACSIGTYQALTGQSSCDDASQGYYVSSTAQSSQTACATGTYQALTGQASCDDADAGYYVPSTALSGQTACLAGTYQALTGQASCNDADAGYYVSSIAQSNQTACLAGTYQALTGQTSCVDADAGYNVPITGQSSQTACAIGTYQPFTGESYCALASQGYYVSTSAQSSQTACSIGTYQGLMGQSSCDDADAGYYVSNTGQSSQTACLAGTYNPNTGSTSSSACGDADVGYYVSSIAQSSQTACSLGTYQALTGQSSCNDADVGYYVSSTAQTSQTTCSIGTYQALTGQASCDDADAGYYVSSTAQSSQTACLAGTYQLLIGQASCNDADAGHYVSSIAQSNQTACLAGTYNPNTGSTSPSACGKADAGYYVSSIAQSNQTACSIGTYQTLTGQSSCDDADVGYNVPLTGQSSQTACSVGTYQSLTGQASCDDADAGHYVPSTAESSQTACSVGTYQSLIGQSSCEDADAGYYVSTTTQSNQTACLAGTYNPNTGSISSSACADAGAGYYVASTGQANQTACLAGTYQTSTGQTSCDNADAGYYVSSTGQSSQTACSIGTYQALTGQSSCDDADVGQYVSSTAQSTYDLAAIGSYVPVSGSSNQTACPPFTSTSSMGSQSIDDCTLDTDLDGTPDTIDADDDNDGTLDGTDDFPLDDTEDTDSDGNGVGDNLQTKQEAKFQTQMLKIGGIVILLIVIGALIFFKRKNSVPESIKEIPVMESNVMGTTAIDVETPLTHPSHLQNELKPLATPNAATPADQVDANGYEWLTHSDGTKWYRVAQSNSEWTKFE